MHNSGPVLWCAAPDSVATASLVLLLPLYSGPANCNEHMTNRVPLKTSQLLGNNDCTPIIYRQLQVFIFFRRSCGGWIAT
jgi:hypothetical protein